MSRRTPPPLVLREFQREAVENLAASLADAAGKMRAAPAQRRAITARIGCALLEAPTGAGKTLMLAATAERIAAEAPVVWFWFAPFKGVVNQTFAALRRGAPGLRVRDPREDRNGMGSRPGDVFVATWAAVAARNAESRRMRTDDDLAPALDTLIGQLRAAGCLIGAVVDEAHHSFRPNGEAFRFFQEVLRPDLLMLATATPDDADVEMLRRALDIVRFQRIAVSRDRAVAERLNKRAVKAVSFVARGVNQGLLDLNEVALRKAVEQHRALKQALRDAQVPMVPLLLVQAASAVWTPARVREALTGRMNFPAGAVAVHTANEPDPDLQALASDPDVEVLVFKMAVATGFDAPRASTLCALRPVQDAGFGLQVIGRIMRVHPLLQSRADVPPALDTGYVFLGDTEGQAGLQLAADRVRAIRDAIEVLSDSVTVYVAGIDDTGAIVVEDEAGQRTLVLTAPEEPAPRAPGVPQEREAAFLLPSATLFGQLETAAAPVGFHAPAPLPPQAPRDGHARARRPLPYRYPMRPNLPVPRRLRTEKMPHDLTVLIDQLVRYVSFTAEHLGIVRQQVAPVERREADLFDPSQVRRMEELAPISDLFARETAWRTLRVSEHIDPQELARRLTAKLAQAVAQIEGTEPPARELRRALTIILVRSPRLCRDALRRAMGACAQVVDAANLPAELESDVPLPESPLNLYGRRPADLNTWEEAFADWLDQQPDRVLWWLRNRSRPNAVDDWSVRIELPDDGRGFYPDFVLCVDGRKTSDGIALAEIKERIESAASAAKSRTDHREYGRALMLTYDSAEGRFVRVEYDASLGRNREAGWLTPSDLVAG